MGFEKNNYQKLTWVNNETQVNATNLNRIENGIEDINQLVNDITDYVNSIDENSTVTFNGIEKTITISIGGKTISTELTGFAGPKDLENLMYEINNNLNNYVHNSSVNADDSVNTIVQRNDKGEIHADTLVASTTTWAGELNFHNASTYTEGGITIDDFGNIKLKPSADTFSISTGDGRNLIRVKNNKELELGQYGSLHVKSGGAVCVGKYWDGDSNAPFMIGNGTSNGNRHNLFTFQEEGLWFGFPGHEQWIAAGDLKWRLTASFALNENVANKRDYIFNSLQTQEVGGISFDQWGNLSIKPDGQSWSLNTNAGSAIKVTNHNRFVDIPNLQGYVKTNDFSSTLDNYIKKDSINGYLSGYMTNSGVDYTNFKVLVGNRGGSEKGLATFGIAAYTDNPTLYMGVWDGHYAGIGYGVRRNDTSGFDEKLFLKFHSSYLEASKDLRVSTMGTDNKSVTTKEYVDSKTAVAKEWVGTQAQYDDLGTYESDRTYYIVEG